MKPSHLPKYSELNRMLNETDKKLHPSEMHGLVCGLVCGNDKNPNWKKFIFENQQTELQEAVDQLREFSATQLKEFSFEFQLILPNEDSKLSERAEALTFWTQGFLTGLKLAEIPIEGRKEGEMTDAINDLIEIAKMDYEEVGESEDDETAYTDLVEYVRLAAILIYQELHDNEKPKDKTSFNPLH